MKGVLLQLIDVKNSLKTAQLRENYLFGQSWTSRFVQPVGISLKHTHKIQRSIVNIKKNEYQFYMGKDDAKIISHNVSNKILIMFSTNFICTGNLFWAVCPTDQKNCVHKKV